MTNHIKHATGAVLFWLLLITASCEPAHACGDYEQPNSAQVVACTVC